MVLARRRMNPRARWIIPRKVCLSFSYRAAYRERNRVERRFAKLKEFRRVATRYEKLRETFLGMIHLALGFIRLRATANVNTA